MKVGDSEIHDGETLTLGGGAGLQMGERSDLLASDLVFRFELVDEARAHSLAPGGIIEDDAAGEDVGEVGHDAAAAGAAARASAAAGSSPARTSRRGPRAGVPRSGSPSMCPSRSAESRS